MKTKFLYLALALFGLSFTACGDDDDDDVTPSQVPEVCTNAFAAKYPDVKNPKWEKNGAYYTAEWRNAARCDVEAWFRPGVQQTQSWVMTETDYGKDLFLVPAELNLAFNKTEYATARIDDIELLEYPDETRNIYIFEVEPTGNAQDVLLIFKASDYTYVKAVNDTGQDITPDTVF